MPSVINATLLPNEEMSASPTKHQSPDKSVSPSPSFVGNGSNTAVSSSIPALNDSAVTYSILNGGGHIVNHNRNHVSFNAEMLPVSAQPVEFAEGSGSEKRLSMSGACSDDPDASLDGHGGLGAGSDEEPCFRPVHASSAQMGTLDSFVGMGFGPYLGNKLEEDAMTTGVDWMPDDNYFNNDVNEPTKKMSDAGVNFTRSAKRGSVAEPHYAYSFDEREDRDWSSERMICENELLEFRDSDFKDSAFSRLNTLRKNRELCDVVFYVGNRNVAAHKIVLAAASPFLYDLFIAAANGGGTAAIGDPRISPLPNGVHGELGVNCEACGGERSRTHSNTPFLSPANRGGPVSDESVQKKKIQVSYGGKKEGCGGDDVSAVMKDGGLSIALMDRAGAGQDPHLGEFYFKFPDIDADSFELLINYAYTASLEASPEQVKNLYRCATWLKMKRCAKACAKYLAKTLTPQNAIGIRKCANGNNDVLLASKVDEYITARFADVMQAKEFTSLPIIQAEFIFGNVVQGSNVDKLTNSMWQDSYKMCDMVLDYLESYAKNDKFRLEDLVDKIHMLYLNDDLTLHNCTDTSDVSGIGLTDHIKDYKRRMYREHTVNRPSAEPGRNKAASRSSPIQSELEHRAASCESVSSVCDEVDWRTIAVLRVSDRYYVGLAVMARQLHVLSIRVNKQVAVQQLEMEGQLEPLEECEEPSAPRAIQLNNRSPQNGNQLVKGEGGKYVTPSFFLTKRGSSDSLSNQNSSASDDAINSSPGSGSDSKPGKCRSSVAGAAGAANSLGGVAGLGEQAVVGGATPSGVIHKLAPMSTPRCGGGALGWNDKIFVTGGYDRAECLNSTEIYDPVENTWSSLAPMNTRRGRFDICVCNDEAYAVYGSDGTADLLSCEKYNFTSDKWTNIASLPIACSFSGCCSVNGSVYCVGGWNGQKSLKECFKFDPAVNAWQQIPPLDQGRYQAACIAFKNLVIVIGGCDTWNCTNWVNVYNTTNDTWTRWPTMTTPRRGCGAAILDGKIYVMGGSDGNQSLTSTEIFDLSNNSWSPGPPMKTPRSNMRAVVAKGRVWAVGGFCGKSFLNTIEYLDTDEMIWKNSLDPSIKMTDTDHFENEEIFSADDDS